MTIGLRHVRCFIAVAEELHFRRAAERLGIAQPALSRTIKNLEEELRVLLFTRTNRRVRITDAGRSFLEGCQAAMNTIEHTVTQTRLVHAGKIGLLRIGYTDAAIAGELPGILKRFRDAHPEVILKPMHHGTALQLRNLDAGELDIGFVTGPINQPEYNQRPVQSERFVCVAYSDHALAGRNSIRLSELAAEAFVHGTSSDWEHFHAYLIPMCRRAGFVPRIVQEAFNTAGILGLVASGVGLTILSESSTIALPTGLVVIPIEDITEELQTVLIWKEDDMFGPKQVFAEFVDSMSADII